MSQHSTKNIIEAALLSAGKPLSLAQLQAMLSEDETPLDKQFVLAALDALADDLSGRGVELRQVASGYRLQVKQEFEPWVARLFEERPPRYSRALLETLALIAYRQPITRAEIEDVRGVSVSSNIVKTLLERDWVKVVGQRDVPGRPSMYGTTQLFLDYFNVKSISELPPLDELMDLDKIDKQLDILDPEAASQLAEDESQGSDAVSTESENVTQPLQAGAQDTASDAPEQHVNAAASDDPTERVESDPDVATNAPSEMPADTTADVTQSVQAGEDNSDDTHPENDDSAAVSEDTNVASDPTEDGVSQTALRQEDADIESLVDMLEAMDKEPDIVDGVPDGEDAGIDDASPSALAREGDTAAAVEAARLALADNALDTLEHIAERTTASSEAVTSRDDTAVQADHTADSDSPVDTSAELLEEGGDHADLVAGEPPVELVEDVADEIVGDGGTTPSDAAIASLLDADSRNHEAARGESVTPADSLWRSSDASDD